MNCQNLRLMEELATKKLEAAVEDGADKDAEKEALEAVRQLTECDKVSNAHSEFESKLVADEQKGKKERRHAIIIKGLEIVVAIGTLIANACIMRTNLKTVQLIEEEHIPSDDSQRKVINSLLR